MTYHNPCFDSGHESLSISVEVWFEWYVKLKKKVKTTTDECLESCCTQSIAKQTTFEPNKLNRCTNANEMDYKHIYKDK